MGSSPELELVLLGDPVAHSRSPAMAQAAFDDLGIAGSYGLRRVDAAGMRAAADDVRDGRLTGANITMPHKALAAALADARSPEVERLGVANTWVRGHDGRIVAHNTDVAGVRHGLALLPRDRPVLVLGAGGAAAAALLAVEERDIVVSARREAAARRLVERVGVRATVRPWETPVAGAVIVNATPIGMHGEALPAAVVAAAEGLLDMTYGPTPSPAVASMGAARRPAVDGIVMLAGQAAAAFELWTGSAVDPDRLEAAARAFDRRT